MQSFRRVKLRDIYDVHVPEIRIPGNMREWGIARVTNSGIGQSASEEKFPGAIELANFLKETAQAAEGGKARLRFMKVKRPWSRTTP